MDLRTQLNQTQFRARLLERALHDRDPWSMSYQGAEVPAVKLLDEDAGEVVFLAEFPAMRVEPGWAVLHLAGEPVLWRWFDYDGFMQVDLEWSLGMDLESSQVA